MSYSAILSEILKKRVILYCLLGGATILVVLYCNLMTPSRAIFLILAFLSAILIFISPAFGIYLLTFEFFLIQRSYAEVGGLSILRIIAVLICFSCLFRKKGIVGLKHPLTIILSVFTLYQFFSYYTYYKTFDFTIFNNLVFYYLVLWALDYNSSKNVIPISFAMLSGALILCLQGYLMFVQQGEFVGRSYLGNTRQVAFYIILSIPFAVVFSSHVKNSYLKLLGKGLIWGFIVYVFMTFGRVNAAIVLMMLTFFLIFNFGQSFVKRKHLLFVLTVLVAFMVVSPKIPRNFLRLPNTGMEFDFGDPTFGGWTSGRARIYKEGIDMFSDSPLFGVGYKSFSAVSSAYNTWLLKSGAEKISMHSTFLQYLAEMGIVGLSFYLATMVMMVLYANRARKYFRTCGSTLLQNVSVAVILGVIAFFIGGLFDNHGILYRQYFLLAAVTTGYLSPRSSNKSM